MKLNWRNIVVNVAVTFCEGFAAAWLVTGNQLDKTALIGAVAAGVSAVWNSSLKPYLRSKKLLYS